MAWCRIGDKPLSEPMLTQFTDAYMPHKGDELTQWGHVALCYLVNIGSGDGLLPARCQAITWTTAELSSKVFGGTGLRECSWTQPVTRVQILHRRNLISQRPIRRNDTCSRCFIWTSSAATQATKLISKTGGAQNIEEEIRGMIECSPNLNDALVELHLSRLVAEKSHGEDKHIP